MYIIGLMSGTSLDGLDIAYCHFDDEHHFTLLAAETVPYPDEWRARLASLHLASAEDYALADVELGHWFGLQINAFRQRHPGPVDCVASHGHTVFHQPWRRLTAQIADGNAIHAATSLPVVFDFRRLDVALGGQGAPLVPIGDRLLFPGADACLNLGGIANISYDGPDGRRVAFDICPCNMALNHLAARLGQPYDRDGQAAASGQVDQGLLTRLEALQFYAQKPPKTLGKEWFEQVFLPLLAASDAPIQDLLRTVVEHVALRLANTVEAMRRPSTSVLITGGGAKNSFLIARFAQLCPTMSVMGSDSQIVDYKEAIIFALLAYLRLKGSPNTLASVTGASRDSSGGVWIG